MARIGNRHSSQRASADTLASLDAAPNSAPTGKAKHQRAAKGAVTTFGSRTDIGLIRDHNEDSLIVSPPLFAVADGMGGHEAGEVASEIAINVLSELAPAHPDGDALARAIEEANREIIRASFDGRGREGMGTTMTAAMLEGERLVIAQVGDSRAYLLHQGSMQQLTRDHSLMADMIEAGKITPEEARVHPKRSVITRALGSDPHTTADIYEINVQAGDRLLLCSDGLYSMVTDKQIEAVLKRTTDPQLCAAQLVNDAIGNGGHDNITVVVADVSGYAAERNKKSALKTKIFVGVILAAIVALCVGFYTLANNYLNTVAYLGEDNGKVAIYKGIPGNVLGVSFSQHVETTSVNVSDLQPGTASHISEGIRVDNVEAAENLVKQYEEDISERGKTSEKDSSGDSNSSSGSSSSNDGNSSSSSSSNSSDSSASTASTSSNTSSASSSSSSSSNSNSSSSSNSNTSGGAQ